MSQAVGVSFSADGTMLATAGSEGVRLWDAATGAALGRIGDGEPRRRCRVQPDRADRRVRSRRVGGRDTFPGSEGGTGKAIAEIWDVDQRSRIATLQVNARCP